MSWGIVAGAAASIVGGALSAKGSKDAAKSAAAGSTEEINFLRESRDIARGDQEPYRKAGVTALNALMSMTGLGGGAAPAAAPSSPQGPVNLTIQDRMESRLDEIRRSGGSRNTAYTRLRYGGGPTGGDVHYNINELGPENYYSGGAVTRGRGPVTIDGETGYVEPHTEGRFLGGLLRKHKIDRTKDVVGAFSGGSSGRVPNFEGNVKLADRQTPPAPVSPADTTSIDPATGFPRENPGGVEGGYNFMTDPGYQFRFEEGQRALDRGAAARGGLMSGGYARKAIRYGQGFASNEYANVYNRIANIAGLGQVSANASGNAALMTGQGMGTAASNRGNATAYGQVGASNAWANTANEVAKLPWADIFNGQPSGASWRPN